MNNSKKITELDSISVPYDDSYFVIADSNNSNKKVSYLSLKDNILENVRNDSIYTLYPPTNNATDNLALGAGVGRKIYIDTQTKIPINGSTTNVSTPINFQSTITSRNPTGNNPYEVVNVEYLNNSRKIFPFQLIKKWEINGTISNGDGISKYKDYIPTPDSKYTLTEDSLVTFFLNWDCNGKDSYGFFMMDNNGNVLKLTGVSQRETSGSLLDTFHGQFYLKQGYKIWFDTYDTTSAKVYQLYNSLIQVFSLSK